MALIWDCTNNEDKLIENIRRVKDLYNSQVQKVENEEYVKNLIFEDYVRTIKKNISKYDYVDIFKAAQNELKEKNKKKRKNLETLENLIRNDFLNNDSNFKLVDIISCGFEDYAWTIYFEGYGKSFYISIPIMKNITTTNIGYADDGMFTFAIKENDFSSSVLIRSYKIIEIAIFVEAYFNLKKSENC